MENYQSNHFSVVEVVQTTAEQLPAEANISPVIGNAPPSNPRDSNPADQRTATLEEDVISMTVLKDENQENYDLKIQ